MWELNTGRAILEVGRRVLAGEIAAARGDYEAAVAALEEGVRLESDLTYDEPPPWDLPVRHVLGAVLLEAGRAAEAERVYEAALRQFEQNGWALAGLIRSLEAQGKDAAVIRAEFREAWRIGDIELESSRL